MAAIMCMYFLSACSILNPDKYDCPPSAAAVGAEKLAAGDKKAIKQASKSKYRPRTGAVWGGQKY